MRKKGNPEFFEVFRRLSETDKSHSWWSKKSKAVTPRPKAGAARDTTTPPGRVALTFNREALAIFIPLMIIALVVSHIWGYTRAEHNMAAKNGGPAQQTGGSIEVAQGQSSPVSQRALSMVAINDMKAPFVTLQIITLQSGQKQNALDMAKVLRDNNYNAFVRQLGRQYTVNVGYFKDNDAANASGYEKKFSSMTYGNVKNAFSGCIYTKVTDTGSIVK